MSLLLNIVDNYITEVAASMLFGLGFYLFKGKKPKLEGEKFKAKLEGALEKYSYAKSIEDFNLILKQKHSKDEDPSQILNFIIENGCIPNIDTYNALLLNCYNNKNFKIANKLKEEIINPEGHITPNSLTLNILIKGLGLEVKIQNSSNNSNTSLQKSNEVINFDYELKKLLGYYKERNIHIDIISRNTILGILIDLGRLEDSWKYYEELLKENIKLDFYTYTTLIKILKKSPTGVDDEGNIVKAFQLYTQAKKISPLSENFYNSLLDCFVRFGSLEKAEKLYEIMLKENNGRLKEYSYSIMIKAYSKSKSLNKALEVFNILKKVKYDEFMLNLNSSKENEAISKKNIFQTNENIFNEKKIQLLEDCTFDENKSYNSNYSHASEATFTTTFTQDLNGFAFINKDKSPYPTTISYGAILNACIKCNNIIKAEEIFQEMEKLFIPKTAFIYATLINGYRNCQNYHKAISLFEMLIKNIQNNPDFLKKHNLSSNIPELLKEQSPTCVNVVTYNNILDCCIECEKYSKMHEIFETMNNIGCIIHPDIITYSIVIKGYAKWNRLDKVLELYEYLSNQSEYTLDEVIYNTMLDCFTRNGDEKSIRKIYKSMRSKNINVSVITYGVLIKFYVNMGNINSANELFEELLNSGIKPSVIIYQLLIRLYSKKQMPYKAIDLFRNMLLMSVKPDLIIFEYIINLCVRSGYWEEAVEFSVLMVTEGLRLEESLIEKIINIVINYEDQMALRQKCLNELFVTIGKKMNLSKYISQKIMAFTTNDNRYNSSNNYYRENYNCNYQDYQDRNYNLVSDNQSICSQFTSNKYRKQSNFDQEYEYDLNNFNHNESAFSSYEYANTYQYYRSSNPFKNRNFANKRCNYYQEEKSIYDI